jgi:AbrB family looped-hinge helix DNA binding protein
MNEARYYKDKIYVPKEIREKLRLRDGDIIRFHLTDDGVKLILLKSTEATNRILERIDDPPNLGKIKGTLRREEIYEDVG